MIAMDMMHSLIRTFVGYGAPVEKDDVGPNKPDWPFFLQIAESDVMNERDLVEAASRFHKYRNTQLPSILMDMNMIDKRDSVDNFLNQRKVTPRYKTLEHGRNKIFLFHVSRNQIDSRNCLTSRSNYRSRNSF